MSVLKFDPQKEYGHGIHLFPRNLCAGQVYMALMTLGNYAGDVLPAGTWFLFRAQLNFGLNLAWHYRPGIPSVVQPVKLRDVSYLLDAVPGTGKILGTAKLLEVHPAKLLWEWDNRAA